MAHTRRLQDEVRTAQVVLALLTCLLVPVARSQEVTVQNDSFVSGGSAVIVGDFIPGEQAGARLTSPCDGAIVAVQIGWLHGDEFPKPAPSLERAIHIFDGSTFPQPGIELQLLEAPLLTSGALNEFRFIDEANTIPLNVPVSKGQEFIVSLEFDNPTNIRNGTASVFRDLDGCQFGKNALFAIPGDWQDFCVVGIRGDLVIRAVIACDELTGACCLPNGDCEVMTASECDDAGGVYQGDLTDCASVNCPEPTGACCFEGAGCIDDLTEAQCSGAGGVFQGGGTICDGRVCFPIGACCLSDGTCIDELSPEECDALEGTFMGDGSECGPGLCPDPVGACCFDTGFCLELTEAQCEQAAANWMGAGTDCTDANKNGTADVCECDPADMNCDGQVNAEDIAPFLGLLFEGEQPCDTCAGDLNGDGVIDALDIQPFLERLFP